MSEEFTDIKALAEAFETFTQTTQRMEEAYRALERRVQELDQELAEKNRELALTTDYLLSLLESMSDGVIAIDPAGHVTRFNQAARQILGYKAEEVEGRPFRDIFGRDFAAPKMPGSSELKAKSGRLVPVDERDSMVSDQTGKRLGSVKTFQDLSELIALREQVRQIDRLAAIGEMAATVAHEIRNPLGGIRGFATFLQQDIPEDDPKRRLVDKILTGAQSLDRVVAELLEYTRPVDLKLKPTPCVAVVESALGYMTLDNARITVENKVDHDLNMLADPDRIRQVFLNILLNAMQSIRETGAIKIAADADSTQVHIHITDTGCGMTEEEQQQIFSPFYTTKEKGTGLGMAICTKIVEGHGGEIQVESEVGKGTTVSVILPRTE